MAWSVPSNTGKMKGREMIPLAGAITETIGFDNSILKNWLPIAPPAGIKGLMMEPLMEKRKCEDLRSGRPGPKPADAG